jgi:hypothetical protein
MAGYPRISQTAARPIDEVFARVLGPMRPLRMY